MDKSSVLAQIFGYRSFRGGQAEIIDNILSGRDALCVMPTGAGKSVCYQIPAIMAEGITLVISPLISLMRDQVSALIQAGIRGAYINSSLTAAQCSKAIFRASQGEYKIIYAAPERLQSEEFISACMKMNIYMVAVDEAHCVSQWGQDFRPGYLKIAEFISKLPKRPIVAAFTATATKRVKEDITRLLGLSDPFTVTTGFDRPNLYFEVRSPNDKKRELLKILAERREKCGIIYCLTRKKTDEVYEMLLANGYSAAKYHAGMETEERKRSQEDFVYDRVRIMVATNAFGMGIDKSDVAYVIHYNMPGNIESYYQEAGRAGRGGEKSECILLYSPGDVHTNKFLIEHSEPNPELDAETQREIREKDAEKLKYMTFYSTGSDCLRGFILKYFGEGAADYCGNCSNCRNGFETRDITIPVKKIISCIAKTGQRFGAVMIADILRGSKNDRLLRFGLDRQPSYGLLSDMTSREIRRIMDYMLARGYIKAAESEMPVLKLTERARDVLYGDEAVTMKVPLAPKPAPNKAVSFEEVDENLLAALKKLRMKTATAAGLPAYIIFSDSTLMDMCRKRPRTGEEFLNISGVGKAKLDRYGKAFMKAIADFEEGLP